MALVFLDFETYYKASGPDKFSLRGSTTEEYIRSPRFETIMVSVAIGDATVYVETGGDAAIASYLRGLDLEKHTVVAHNAQFDAMILNWHFGIRPKCVLDTIAMAALRGYRAAGSLSLSALAQKLGIGAKGDELKDADGKRRADFTTDELARLAGYCANDTALLRDIYKVLRPQLSVADLAFIDFSTRMYTEPVLDIDAPLCAARLAARLREKETALARLAKPRGETADTLAASLRSNDKFAELLTGLGVVPGVKPSPTDPSKQTYAFAKSDRFMDALLADENPTIAALAEARLGERSHIEESRLERFVGIAERGLLPVPLTVAGAHTGRYSGGQKINIQNLPKRKGGDLTLRRALRAPAGYSIVAADSSQIEVRVLAYLAGHDTLLESFRQGRDPYSELAATLFRGDAQEIKAGAKAGIEPFKSQRQMAKSAVLGAGFGMGPDRFREYCWLSDRMVIEPDMARSVIYGYREVNAPIAHFWKACQQTLDAMYERRSGEFVRGTRYGVLASSPSIPTLVLPDEFPICYPDLSRIPSAKGGWEYSFTHERRPSRTYGGKVAENLTQGYAFAVLRAQAVDVFAKTGCRPRLNVHDEWVYVEPTERAAEIEKAVVAAMSTAPSWAPGLPLACESGIASNYADV